MSAAATVIARRLEARRVVVVEHKMFAFKAHGIAHTTPVLIVLRDHKRARLQRDYYPRRVNVTALIVTAASILRRANSDVGRVSALTILRAVGARDKDRVIGMVRAGAVIVFARDGEKLRESFVNRTQSFGVRTRNRQDARAARRHGLILESIAADVFRSAEHTPARVRAALREKFRRSGESCDAHKA